MMFLGLGHEALWDLSRPRIKLRAALGWSNPLTAREAPDGYSFSKRGAKRGILCMWEEEVDFTLCKHGHQDGSLEDDI